MIYICGDLHGTYNTPQEEYFLKHLSREDILIVLGDFGWDWTYSDMKRFSLPCETLFIDGNHECFPILYGLDEVERYGAPVGVFNDRTFWLKRGNLYTIEGKTFFCFGGANSVDKLWRVPYKSWWPEEIPSWEEYQHALDTLEKCNYRFDYFLSHTCSEYDEIHMLGYDNIIDDRVSDMIGWMERLIEENDGGYTMHLFGHHHKLVQDGNHLALFQQAYCIDDNALFSFD